MLRRNRRRERPQHTRSFRAGKRPRGWHRRYSSGGVREAMRWLLREDLL